MRLTVNGQPHDFADEQSTTMTIVELLDRLPVPTGRPAGAAVGDLKRQPSGAGRPREDPGEDPGEDPDTGPDTDPDRGPDRVPDREDPTRVAQQRPVAFAVEVNRRVVPRRDHAATLLQDGDSIEIVTLVGGG